MIVIVVVIVCSGISAGTPCHFLVSIPFGCPEIHKEVEQTKNGQEPVEIVKMAPVQVIWNPTKLTIPRGDFTHNCNKQSAQVIA